MLDVDVKNVKIYERNNRTQQIVELWRKTNDVNGILHCHAFANDKRELQDHSPSDRLQQQN